MVWGNYRMFIPEAIKNILFKIQKSGHSAYLVGGSVRDYFLCRKQMDFDIASSANPEEIIHLFKKTIPTGLKHGTVTVIEDGMSCEVTTFRTDGKYDGRRPESVSFSPYIEIDLSRRDFTINAIAYDGNKFVDPFHGIQDIQKKIIRSVGNPSHRFREDGLRMLRAVRFSAQLGFDIEEHTKLAIIENSNILTRISMERIRNELDKILLSDNASVGISLLKELQLLENVILELYTLPENKFKQILSVLDQTHNNLNLRLATILLFIPNVHSVMSKLKYDRKRTEVVTNVLRENHIDLSELSVKQIKKLLQRIGIQNLYVLLDLQTAIQQSGFTSNNHNGLQRAREFVDQIVKSGEPIYIKDMAINGNDLKKIGVSEGKIIGSILDSLLELVLEQPSMNNKEQLMKYIRQWYAHEIKSKEL